MQWDLIVVGAGLAGLTVANRAAALDLKPLVLERGGAEDYPCNSRFSGGLIHVAYRDMVAGPDAIRRTISKQVTSESANQHASVLAEDSGRALAWLKSEGVRFIKGGALEFMQWVLAPPRPRRPGLDWKGRGPDVMLRTLTGNLRRRGGELRIGCRAVSLTIADGAVTGLTLEDREGNTEALHAKAVVIADGGFQANPDLVRRYVSPAPDKLFQRGAATGFGDGLLMAEAAGAAVVGLDRFYGHLLGRETFTNPKLWPYPTVDALAQAAIVVNESGQRFVDEGQGGVFMANQVAQLENPLSATVVFDDALWTGLAADNRYPPCLNPSFVQEGGTVYSAPTLEELAQTLKLPPTQLAATVAAYNAAVAGETTDTLSPTRSTNRFSAHALTQPPYRAIKVCAGITYSMGGIAIDAQSRALNSGGNAIAGLYAVGAASGGMEGGSGAVYLGGLSKAVITGLRAAEALSQAVTPGAPSDQPLNPGSVR